jgi:LPXTG-motif cell wall-anchored protein
MDNQSKNSLKSLYISLFLVGAFVLGIVAMQLPRINAEIGMSDNVMAGSEEPVETIIPIGGSDEATNAPIPTVSPVISSSPTSRPTLQPAFTSSPTPVLTPEPTLIPMESATPVPTFDLNLPGDTTGNTPTNPPVAQTEQSNNLPIVIGVIVGVLLIAGGIILVLVKRRSQAADLTPPTTPPQTPPIYPTSNIQTPDQGGYNTPYDQYMNNQPKTPPDIQQ